MNTKNFGQELDEIWNRLDHAATEEKFSHQATIEIRKIYLGWDTETQRLARREFGKWLYSPNARKRFDALSLIEEFSTGEIGQDLYNLKEKLEHKSGPEAAFELRRICEILEKLAKKGDGAH